jgi:hypothetical protein
VWIAAAMGAGVACVMAGAALAAPGQCSMTEYGTFDCDVTMDGGGLTFGLPDGQTFAFALVDENEGLGYLIAPDARPGQRPDELGPFSPDADAAGCWISDRKSDMRFCAMVAQ